MLFVAYASRGVSFRHGFQQSSSPENTSRRRARFDLYDAQRAWCIAVQAGHKDESLEAGVRLAGLLATPPVAQQPAAQQPVTTTETDWTGVAQELSRPGKLSDTVYRVAPPRGDLTVVSQGVSIKPGLSLVRYAVFTRYPDATMVMDALVVTEAELPKVADALLANRINITGLHKHLLNQSPAIWWMHIHAMGDPMALAKASGRHSTPGPPRPLPPHPDPNPRWT